MSHICPLFETLKPSGEPTLHLYRICIGYEGLIRLLTLIGHLYLGGVWLSADVRTDIKRHVLKKIGLYAQNLLSIIGFIVNRIEGTYVPFLWLTFSIFDESLQIKISSETF